jgi:hypothetical protein
MGHSLADPPYTHLRMKTPRFKDDDFLCEKCGYVLSGLRLDGHCPECGTPIAQSHPDRRVGTLWQVRNAAPATIIAMLTRPGKVFETAAPDVEHSMEFKHLCIFGAGLATSLAIAVVYFGQSTLVSASGNLSLVASIVVANLMLFGIPVSLLLWTLTAIEHRGIRAFGRLNNRRITPPVAETIVAHASAAWFTVPVLMVLMWLAGLLIRTLAERFSWALWELTLTAPYWTPVLGAFAGMLWFEIVVWTGVRRMRFANSPSVARRVQN